MNELQSFASGAADSFTFGWGDEIVGALFGEQAMEASRQRQEQARAEHGGWFLGGQVGGALAGGGGIGAAVRGGLGAARLARLGTRVGPMGRIAFGGAAGGVGGALYGAGDAPDGQRFEGAVNSALPGAVGGAAFQGLGEAGGRVLGAVQRSLSPEARAGRMMAEGLERFGPRTTNPAAVERQTLDALRNAPDNATVGDVVPGFTPLVRGAGVRPSAEREALREAFDNRNNAMGGRLADEAWSTLATSARSRDPVAVMDAFRADRRARAMPLYREVDAQPIDGARMDRTLGEVVRRNPRLFQDGERRAQELMRSEHGTVFNQNDPRYWHYLLQGAQGAYETMRTAGKMGQPGGLSAVEAGRYGQVLHRFNGMLRAALGPKFRQAQDIWSGSVRNEMAVSRGYEAVTPNINSIDLGNIRRDLARMTPGEREAFRIGAVSRLSDMLKNADTGSGRADVLRAISRNQGQREVLETVFGGTTQFRNFMRSVDEQRALFDTSVQSGIGVNSHTADRIAAQASQEALTRPAGLRDAVMRLFTQDVADRFDERVSGEILRTAGINANQAASEIAQVGGFQNWAGGRGLLSRAVRERQRMIRQRPEALVNAITTGAYYAPVGGAAAQYGMGGY